MSKRILLVLLLLICSVSFAGNKLPKKLRKEYVGFFPEYSVTIGENILKVDKTKLLVELKETHALVEFDGIKYNLKIEDLKKKKSIYYFSFSFPSDTHLGKLSMELNKKQKTILVKGPGVIPDAELK